VPDRFWVSSASACKLSLIRDSSKGEAHKGAGCVSMQVDAFDTRSPLVGFFFLRICETSSWNLGTVTTHR
jgi:hypothetical protein